MKTRDKGTIGTGTRVEPLPSSKAPTVSKEEALPIGPADEWLGSNSILSGLPFNDSSISKAEHELQTLYTETFPSTERSFDQTSRPLSPGVAHGRLALGVAEAQKYADAGQPFVLFVDRITPKSTVLAALSEGVILSPKPDNRTFAQTLRSMGKPAVVGVPVNGLFPGGSSLTLDGTRGGLHRGQAEIIPGKAPDVFREKLQALSHAHNTSVVVESSTPQGVAESVAYGAEQVRVDADALLFAPQVVNALRRYLVETEAAPKRALLEQILTEVRAQAETLITAAKGADLTFAIGSRSPKSFFPAPAELLAEVAKTIGMPTAVVRDRVEALGSGNSKLGLRGARLGVKDPELFGTIAKALFEAAAATKDDGQPVGALRLLVPSVSLPGEMKTIRGRLDQERKAVEADFGLELAVGYGAGIDTAAGALNMAGISEHSHFAEYGLEGLTESVFGISRDDAKTFMPESLAAGIYPADPFEAPASDFLGKLISVGQYLAGDSPNSFPASVRGQLASKASAIVLANAAGIDTLVVPPTQHLQAHLQQGKVLEYLDDSKGIARTVPSPQSRDVQVKVLDVLAGQAPGLDAPKLEELPEGVTPLEHVEQMIRRVKNGTMNKDDVLLGVEADIVNSLRRPVVDPKANPKILSKGIGASPGCGQGHLALSHEKAEEYEREGKPYVLLVSEVHAEDVPAVRMAEGLISVRGGKTSHSAMIASNSDVPCVMDEKAKINLEKRTAQIGKTTVKEGDIVTLDGIKGHVMFGEVPLLNPANSTAYSTLMEWADAARNLDVMANADTPDEAAKAFEAGASGVGLVRSEHMFFGEERLLEFRAAILADGARQATALQKIEGFQAEDFTKLFEAADGKKVAVRLLDPPLYEFMPTSPAGIQELASKLDLPAEEVARRIDASQEVDSLMGLRGARLSLARPEIEATQIRALARAFIAAKQAGKNPGALYITVPMINTGAEMAAAATRIRSTLAEVEAEASEQIPLKLGGMIETPASALEAGEIAKHCDYMSYGTNDLTQLVLGFGRNVAPQFIPSLLKAGALKSDPSSVLNRETVGKMMQVTEFLGRDQNPDLQTGICGAQGSDPESVRLVEKLGLNYVSVPPSQVPRARLAASQAAILNKRSKLESSLGAIAPVSTEMPAEATTLYESLSRTLAAIKEVPMPASQQYLLDRISLSLRRSIVYLREVMALGPAAIHQHLPLFEVFFETRSAVSGERLAAEMTGEVSRLRRELDDRRLSSKGRSPSTPAGNIEAKLRGAEESIRAFSEKIAAGARGKPGKRSSSSERDTASHAWSALRAIEDARTGLITELGMSETRAAFDRRVRHKNDGWDNPHYTRSRPIEGDTMGSYLKRVASEFMKDNGFSCVFVGAEQIPSDKPVVFALSHRSGAIDRFATMASLPVGDDDFMYIVRENSPLDVVAKEAYGEGNGSIIPARGLKETSETIKNGFESGKRFLITYPEGTGTLAGEPRYVATGTVLMALNAGATIVPVTSHDTFESSPLEGGSILARAGSAIDLDRIRRELGPEATDTDVVAVAQTQLQFALGSEYRL